MNQNESETGKSPRPMSHYTSQVATSQNTDWGDIICLMIVVCFDNIEVR